MPARPTQVLVIGAGHAGCEAALAAARMGCQTTLVTSDLDKIAKAPCNPAMGGPGKAQLIREVDALGGAIARVADAAMLNVRVLNTGKGPAMHALRAVIDRDRYEREMRQVLEGQPNLHLVEGLVEALTWEGGRITGAVTRDGLHLRAQAVVVTTGTFLRGRCHIGEVSFAAGRAGEPPAVGLSHSLRALGLRLGRLNTGTTPRVLRDSLRTEGLEVQPTATEPLAFSTLSEPRVLPPDFPVYITQTTEETHRILRANFHRNPGKNGTLGGVGPRYCPSIETKILRFPKRTSHKVFLEPEGASRQEIYLGGFATSAPPEVQEAAMRTIPGLEEAVIARYGYDVEYDFVYPTQLEPSLEAKALEGLFLAGQINGTTGYEEAAAQGVLAGINAALKLKGQEPLILRRDEAFLGVMVDDLVTKGTEEPYRMLPSRAEYRLILRQSNADLRLMDYSYRLELVSEERYARLCEKRRWLQEELKRLKATRVFLNLNGNGHDKNESPRGTKVKAKAKVTLYEALKRPELTYRELAALDPHPHRHRRRRRGRSRDRDRDGEAANGLPREWVEELEIQVKYSGYIRRQRDQIARLRRLEAKRLPEDLPYEELHALSSEGRQKLAAVRPRTLGQAARVPGVSQSDLAALMVILKMREGCRGPRSPSPTPKGS